MVFGGRRHAVASRSKVSIQRATVLFTKYRAEFRLVPVWPRRRPDAYASSYMARSRYNPRNSALPYRGFVYYNGSILGRRVPRSQHKNSV